MEGPAYKKRKKDKETEHGRKLYFVRNEEERFELEELLGASAEVLGSGSFGSSYKAAVFSGQAYVVRRFRQMNNVGKQEFYEHMRRLGRLSHPNLLPLVAFYYRKEEKLLITQYVENGSLANKLHARRCPNEPVLGWPTRLRIIKGVARGLAYLYKELPTVTLPHGHLKSSNILLDSKYEPLLSDYGLVPVMSKDHAQQFMVAYKSPESTQKDRVTRKTDVWSLGILILELLTGRFPANYLKQGKGPSADLATWVNSVVKEEWTGEVFDKDMNPSRHTEGQMFRLLKIGMCCCEWNVAMRWDLKEAVERIVELKERDDDDDYYSCASEGDMYSSRAMTDDDLSFSSLRS
ncbi:UNVERIFIED_CONTAM: putative LRR receptor-like serine/threonine-protein kinase [Sesamum calycinum]|uniref:LRR receptor-like serine/threonine-protein kinase n=1 Tax=Sesamum calycinum TaxID=2727403 RepID=A0AAW2LYW0_9LAMI